MLVWRGAVLDFQQGITQGHRYRSVQALVDLHLETIGLDMSNWRNDCGSATGKHLGHSTCGNFFTPLVNRQLSFYRIEPEVSR
jgi:hypothetical protein